MVLYLGYSYFITYKIVYFPSSTSIVLDAFTYKLERSSLFSFVGTKAFFIVKGVHILL